MGSIDYGRFNRILLRCAEVAAEPGMKASVVRVYDDTLKVAADQFHEAYDSVAKAESSFNKENREAIEALTALDAPYREARSVIKAYAPETVLPETLKVLRTDTDKLDAIEKLVDVLDDHSGEPWADELSQGEIGKKAAATVKELNESIAANKALAAARDARASTYGPAYERYLRFKRVVRDALGAKSAQYKRIHIRANAGADDAAPETRPDRQTAKPKAGTPPAPQAAKPQVETPPAPQAAKPRVETPPASAGARAAQPAPASTEAAQPA